jgi:hypothetical protein
MEKYCIKEENWQKIYVALLVFSDIRVVSETATRPFVEAVYFILKTGFQ